MRQNSRPIPIDYQDVMNFCQDITREMVVRLKPLFALFEKAAPDLELGNLSKVAKFYPEKLPSWPGIIGGRFMGVMPHNQTHRRMEVWLSVNMSKKYDDETQEDRMITGLCNVKQRFIDIKISPFFTFHRIKSDPRGFACLLFFAIIHEMTHAVDPEVGSKGDRGQPRQRDFDELMKKHDWLTADAIARSEFAAYFNSGPELRARTQELCAALTFIFESPGHLADMPISESIPAALRQIHFYTDNEPFMSRDSIKYILKTAVQHLQDKRLIEVKLCRIQAAGNGTRSVRRARGGGRSRTDRSRSRAWGCLGPRRPATTRTRSSSSRSGMSTRTASSCTGTNTRSRTPGSSPSWTWRRGERTTPPTRREQAECSPCSRAPPT